ncbi:MAG TPA: tetratricopeptide repeat protein [Streptosporangiaceae bacterium]|jgi:tetratricopeptide (TPR) repeat protein
MNTPLSTTAGREGAVRTGAPPALADGFTDRPETVPGLPARLIPGAVIALLSGRAPGGEDAPPPGSAGKTQLAVHCAESLWRSGQTDLLAWIDASSRASVLAGYAQAAAAAGLGESGPAEQVAAGLADWLAQATRPWLVVLDGLRDPADLAGLWISGPAGMVIITAPDEKTARGDAGQACTHVIGVGPYSTREALSYLMSRLANDPDQRSGGIDLVTALDGDPCALAHAAALVATTTQTCRDYYRYFTDYRDRLEAASDAGTPTAPTAITWTLSADRAAQLAGGGTTRLQLLLAALLDGQPVPGQVFTAEAACKFLAEAGSSATDPESAWRAVQALERTGLLAIDGQTAPPLVRVSRAVAEQVRASAPGHARSRAAAAVADALTETWPEDDQPPWLATVLRSCAAALQHTAGGQLTTPDGWHPLLLRAGRSLDAAGLAGPAVSHWSQLAAGGGRELRPDNPQALDIAGRLAQALLAAGQPEQAVAWWQWTAASRSRLYGPDHPGSCAAQLSLGHAMTVAGQPGDAVGVLEQAVAGFELVHGPGEPPTLAARQELAAACQAAGRASDAAGHYRRVLTGYERLHGARHPATLAARDSLAGACLADGRVKEATSQYKQVVADAERALGVSHPGTITARRNLAAAYHAAGKVGQALQLHERVCADYGKVLGASHPDTLTGCLDLAAAYGSTGHLADQVTLLRETLSRCEQALPASDPLTEAVRQALAGIAG